MTDLDIIKHLNSISDLLVALQTNSGRRLNIQRCLNLSDNSRYWVKEDLPGTGFNSLDGFGPSPDAAYAALQEARTVGVLKAQAKAEAAEWQTAREAELLAQAPSCE